MPSSEALASPLRSVRCLSTKRAPKAMRMSVVDAAMTPPASQNGSKTCVAATLRSGIRTTPLIDVKCRTHIAATRSRMDAARPRTPRSTWNECRASAAIKVPRRTAAKLVSGSNATRPWTSMARMPLTCMAAIPSPSSKPPTAGAWREVPARPTEKATQDAAIATAMEKLVPPTP